MDKTISDLAEPPPSHFELVYWRNTHYDNIVSKMTGIVCRESLKIEIEHSFDKFFHELFTSYQLILLYQKIFLQLSK